MRTNQMQLNYTKIRCNFVHYFKALLFIAVLAYLAINRVLAAQTLAPIPISELSGFDTQFATTHATDFIDAQSVMGQVSYKPGVNYTVLFAFDVAQINYLYANGSHVKKGAIVATIQGSDVQHFLDTYQSAKDMLNVAKSHYDINKVHLKNKIIRSSEWVTITQSYYAAKLSFEHLNHQMRYLQIDEQENVSLISPKAGILQFPTQAANRMLGERVFDILDPNSIEVKFTVPISLGKGVSYFRVSDQCQLNIKSVDSIANKYHQTIWASPSSAQCNLTIGQSIKAVPVKKITGYSVAKSALFEFENTNYIAVKADEHLEFVPVQLIGSRNQDFIFSANIPLNNRQVLISSVSALQGMLLHLGRE